MFDEHKDQIIDILQPIRQIGIDAGKLNRHLDKLETSQDGLALTLLPTLGDDAARAEGYLITLGIQPNQISDLMLLALKAGISEGINWE